MLILTFARLIFLKIPNFLCQILKIDTFNNVNDPEDNLSNRNNRVYVPKLKFNRYQNNFCFQAPKIWNSLASASVVCGNITTAPTMTVLRKTLKQFLLKMQLHGVNNNDLNWYDFNHSIVKYIAMRNKSLY